MPPGHVQESLNSPKFPGKPLLHNPLEPARQRLLGSKFGEWVTVKEGVPGRRKWGQSCSFGRVSVYLVSALKAKTCRGFTGNVARVPCRPVASGSLSVWGRLGLQTAFHPLRGWPGAAVLESPSDQGAFETSAAPPACVLRGLVPLQTISYIRHRTLNPIIRYSRICQPFSDRLLTL